jgi:hypothetical protein
VSVSTAGTAAARPGGGRRALYLHVGVPKSGTSFLQSLLADHRDQLRAHGFIYPFVRPEAMFHAAVELRGQHERWGLAAETVDGSWQRLLARAASFDGTAIISHEIFAGAVGPEIVRIHRDTADWDLHIVVTARDLARQATAHWQEEVKNGRGWSFEEFRGALWDPEESEANEVGFWRSQDLRAVLHRWSSVVPEENIHVVVVPPPGAGRSELWRRFAGAVGLPDGLLDPEVAPSVNESLGAAQVALLRRVVTAVDGRILQPQFAHVVKRYFAQRELGALQSAPAVAPPDLRRELDETMNGWIQDISGSGFAVHGDLQELLSAGLSDEPTAPHPDLVTAEQMLAGLPEVVADLLVEIAALRSAVARLPSPAAPTPRSGARNRALRRALRLRRHLGRRR